MAEPNCKTCKHFDAAPRGEGCECRDLTKRIFVRNPAASEVSPPWIENGEIYTFDGRERNEVSSKLISVYACIVGMLFIASAFSAMNTKFSQMFGIAVCSFVLCGMLGQILGEKRSETELAALRKDIRPLLANIRNRIEVMDEVKQPMSAAVLECGLKEFLALHPELA